MDEAMTDAAQPGPSNAVVPVADASGSEVDLSKHPSGIIPQLQNVVATVNLGCSLDLKTIALHARNAEYNPKVHNLNSVTQVIAHGSTLS